MPLTQLSTSILCSREFGFADSLAQLPAHQDAVRSISDEVKEWCQGV